MLLTGLWGLGSILGSLIIPGEVLRGLNSDLTGGLKRRMREDQSALITESRGTQLNPCVEFVPSRLRLCAYSLSDGLIA